MRDLESSNYYYPPLLKLFNRLVLIKHTVNRLDSISRTTIAPNSALLKLSMSRFGISDISGPTANGWEINGPTAAASIFSNITIRSEFDQVIVQQCSFYSAQCFESLETYVKDMLRCFSKNSHQFDFFTTQLTPLKGSRSSFPGGVELLKLLKKVCGSQYQVYSKKNNADLDFNAFWHILSETRHAIVHSQGRLKKTKYCKDRTKIKLINRYYDIADTDDEHATVFSSSMKLNILIKNLSEFAYQVYKILSMNDNLLWDLITPETTLEKKS